MVALVNCQVVMTVGKEALDVCRSKKNKNVSIWHMAQTSGLIWIALDPLDDTNIKREAFVYLKKNVIFTPSEVWSLNWNFDISYLVTPSSAADVGNNKFWWKLKKLKKPD